MNFQVSSDTGSFLLSLLWFTLFFMWIWIWISVIADIFRSPDLGGWSKALWCIFTVFLPFLGVFVYLIARGSKMAEHSARSMAAMQAAQADYIRDVAGTSGGGGAAGEIERLAALRDQGVITAEEFEAGKAKALA